MKTNWVTGDLTPEEIAPVARGEVVRETAEVVLADDLGSIFGDIL